MEMPAYPMGIPLGREGMTNSNFEL